MPWTVDYTDTALRQLRKLDRRMARRVKVLTGPMGGLWRYRIGQRRVICELQDQVLRVLVLRVAGRDQAYR